MTGSYTVVLELSKEDTRTWDIAQGLFRKNEVFYARAEIPIIRWEWRTIYLHSAEYEMVFPDRGAAQEMIIHALEQDFVGGEDASLLLSTYPTLKEKVVIK
jgi:hypothetical protein